MWKFLKSKPKPKLVRIYVSVNAHPEYSLNPSWPLGRTRPFMMGNTISLNVVGSTVGDVFETLVETGELKKGATPLINGRGCSLKYRLEPGDFLSFKSSCKYCAGTGDQPILPRFKESKPCEACGGTGNELDKSLAKM